MTALTLSDCDNYTDDEQERFQKLVRRHKPLMPVHRSHSAIRASHKTSGSRKAARMVSRRNGGMHHRRLTEIS
jgi:hypothetical protein